MEVLVVEFRKKRRTSAEQVADFSAAIVDNARASRQHESGCRQFDLCRDAQDP